MDDAVKAKMEKIDWVPLESNPEMLSEFARSIGMPAKGFEFVDIYGTDPELLGMVPPGTLAVTLLFESSENIRKVKQDQKAQIEAKGQTVSPNIRYMKQYVGNACGTIATIHALANNV